MSDRKDRSVGVKVLAAVSSLALIITIVLVLVVGINIYTGLVMAAAFGGIAGPAVMAGDSVLECVSGFFEIFIEGVLSIFEAIAEIFGSIFS